MKTYSIEDSYIQYCICTARVLPIQIVSIPLSDTVLLRKSPPAYGDGVYTMAGQNRPNPFDISERAHRSNIAASLGSVRGRTAMQVYFGKMFTDVDKQEQLLLY